MASTFSWLDYSEHERRKMLDVIELFGERTTRDELGLGGIRDAFADLLFPGTSTIQTAAKYFLLVPWVYQVLEQKRTPSSQIELKARKLEIELARHLEESGESDGVIGRIAKEKLRRLPSSIYWNGLLLWGIRVFPGSHDEYHRSLDAFYVRQGGRRASRREHDGESVDEPDLHNWHVGLPQPPEGFPKGAELQLRRQEAEYLREQLLTNCPRCLMAWLVRERVQTETVPFVWDLAVNFPETLDVQVRHSQNFSEIIHGAQLLYNLMLAEKRSWHEKSDDYRQQIKDWWNKIRGRRTLLRAWDIREFWRIVYQGNPRVSSRARGFVKRWIDLVLAANDMHAIVDGDSRQFIEHREVQIKGGMARLKNQHARERWNGAAGAAQLDLRWGSARRIISNILEGLEQHADA